MTTMNIETESENSATGLLVIGGTVKEIITTSEPTLIREHLGSLLQVKNLVVLLGSGASFHLGSPKTRDLTNKQVLGLIREAGGEPTAEHHSLLAHSGWSASMAAAMCAHSPERVPGASRRAYRRWTRPGTETRR